MDWAVREKGRGVYIQRGRSYAAIRGERGRERHLIKWGTTVDALVKSTDFFW